MSEKRKQSEWWRQKIGGEMDDKGEVGDEEEKVGTIF